MVMRIAGGEGRGEFVRQSEHSEDETLIIVWGRNIQYNSGRVWVCSLVQTTWMEIVIGFPFVYVMYSKSE
jgi:hypothetical protein